MRKIITITLTLITHLTLFTLGVYVIDGLPPLDPNRGIHILLGILLFIIFFISASLSTIYLLYKETNET